MRRNRRISISSQTSLGMASADLRQELDCSICQSMYTDPVTLRCGHNFCRDCIDRVLDIQQESGAYSCPECRAKRKRRPGLIRNIPLCNIVGRFLETLPDQEDTGIFCSYCIHCPVPASKSCLHCEAHLCDNHLRVHSKSPEHVLSDPTAALGNRKCSVHKRILEYYCSEDAVCICMSCCLIGEHKGHQMESLDEASEKRKVKLRDVLQKLSIKRTEAEKRVQSLQERRREDQGKAAGVIERVTALFSDIRRQLEDLEKRVLSEIFRQEEHVSLSVSDLIQQLEIKKDELSRKISHIEELCNMSDPVTVIQEPDTGDFCDTQVRKRRHTQVHDGGDLDVGLISGTLHTLSDIITGINTGIYVQEPADTSLDVTTAVKTESDTISGTNTGISVHKSTDTLLDITTAVKTELDIITDINTGDYVQEATDLLLDEITSGAKIQISDDGKTATRSDIIQRKSKYRFQYPQVISTREFSSGRHYWDVDVSKAKWKVGMCYPSIDKCGRQSEIGYNNKSWSLCMEYNCQYLVSHDGIVDVLDDSIPCDRVRVYLDYEAGLLSFYSLCDPIRHIYTYSATFTEPLHAAVFVKEGCITTGLIQTLSQS
ncbi:E3 ubiquitin/ISG15 ligase TRIM25-like [Pseudophryne corroboree]|uniref:E3 ubiquitin/ISG15 ligase TRIM25-like n=1 Tax=Pseudophryne corroboree TaxID=495146 RepID=UPI003081EEFD